MSTKSAAWQPIDVQTEAITGWRCWFVLPEEGLLRPIFKRGLRWPPRTAQEALCADNEHQAPDEDCKCGIYAVCAPLLLQEVYWTSSPPKGVKPLPGIVVVGQLSLWGKVIQHERGWRAQFAYPTHLYAFTDDEAVAERLRAHYQVPVVWGAEAARLRRLLPPPDIDVSPIPPALSGRAWSETLLALARSEGWPKNVSALYGAYQKDATSRHYGTLAMKWADWSPPAERIAALGKAKPEPATARKIALAKREAYAVRFQKPLSARRALWVRLVRWRRAAIWEAWDTPWIARWLEDAREDLARGTTQPRRKRPPRPYAASTLQALKYRVKDLTESVGKNGRALQAEADMWVPSYREWRTLLQAPARPATRADETRPDEAPWRDWQRLIVWERRRLAVERGLLALDRERLEAERAERGEAVTR
jgi:hypothetical protein